MVLDHLQVNVEESNDSSVIEESNYLQSMGDQTSDNESKKENHYQNLLKLYK